MTEEQQITCTPAQTILVVDDDLMSLEMLIRILSADYIIKQAQSGEEALQLLATMDPPDLILTDIIMPEMDGYALYRRIREMSGLSEVPLIFLTCMTESECESEGLELGAVDYIAKPYNPHLVRLRVRNHLLLKKRQDELSREISKSKQMERLLCESEASYRLLFENMVGGFALHEMIYDQQGSPSDYRFLAVNQAFENMTGITAAAAVEHTAKELLPGIEQHWIDLYGTVAETGTPMSFQNYARDVGRYFDVWAFSPAAGRFATVFIDISERMQMEDKLRCITDAANDAILMMDPEGKISYWNKAAEEILGYSGDEVLGKDLHRLLAPERYQAAHNAAYPAFLQTGQGNAVGKRLELSAIRKDGQEIKVAVSLSGVMLYGAWHAVGIIRDITELKRYQSALEQARDAADAANRAKSEFLANMSHEIRTPMNGVIGMAQLLRFTELTQEQEEYLSSIEISADNLLQLINDILDLSKIESGKLELECTDFSLLKAIEDLIITQQSNIFKKKLNLQKELPANLPEVLKGDQLRVKQVLLNLLSNAVKFTEQGSITIAVELLEQDTRTALIRLTVSDTGIGITPEELKKVFNPFEQADTSITRRFGGTGLGLTICRTLVELMGGSIWAESVPGQGSSFHLELPFELSTAQRKPAQDSHSLPKSIRSLAVLVAEDAPMNQRFIEMVLQKLGHRAICTNNGQEALERWRKGGVDLILMDIQMPVMDGIKAAGAIREEQKQQGGHTPIVALTADALKGSREQMLECGFDGYLTKPLKLKLLVEELERLT